MFIHRFSMFLPRLAPHVDDLDLDRDRARPYLPYMEGSVSHDRSSSDLGSWICVLSPSFS